MRRTWSIAAVLALILMLASSVALADGNERGDDNLSATQLDSSQFVDFDGTQQAINLSDQNHTIDEMIRFTDNEDDRLGPRSQDGKLFDPPAERSRAPPQELNQANVDLSLAPEANEIDMDNAPELRPAAVQESFRPQGGTASAA